MLVLVWMLMKNFFFGGSFVIFLVVVIEILLVFIWLSFIERLRLVFRMFRSCDVVIIIGVGFFLFFL